MEGDWSSQVLAEMAPRKRVVVMWTMVIWESKLM